MIHQVAVPIYRTKSQEVVILEAHEYGDASNPNHPDNIIGALAKEAIEELDRYFHDEYRIVDTYESTNKTTTYRTYVLYKSEAAPIAATAAAANAGAIDLAFKITKKQTYSKSTKQYFDYWRLDITDGRMVNVFNHPDDSRNTYKIVQKAGWGDLWEQLADECTYLMVNPLPVTVTLDGEWLRLEQIAHYADFMDFFKLNNEEGDTDEISSQENQD